MRSEFEDLLYNNNIMNKSFYFRRIYSDYSILNLKNEIDKVLSSLNKVELIETPFNYVDEEEKLLEDIFNQISGLP